ncbi:MAG: hypothetical protein ACYTAN_17410 [Planctomycetota bacterium]|jgi:hypothetical protein
MTPHEATIWLRQFVYWGNCKVLSIHAADMFGAHLKLGMFGKVVQYAQNGWYDRRLCIFVRRLVRLVDGYKRPVCGWCSDTGVVIDHRTGGPRFCCGARAPEPFPERYDTDCAAACALISERYRPKTFEQAERDRKNLEAVASMTTAAQRSQRWQQRRRRKDNNST